MHPQRSHQRQAPSEGEGEEGDSSRCHAPVLPRKAVLQAMQHAVSPSIRVREEAVTLMQRCMTEMALTLSTLYPSSLPHSQRSHTHTHTLSCHPP